MADKSIFGEPKPIDEQIAVILEREVCQQMDDGASFLDYSGRGMMGAKCMAITGTEQECRFTLAQFNFVIAQHAMEWVMADPGCKPDIDEMLRQMTQNIMQYSQDRLGHDVVYYWPSIPIPEDRNG